MLRPSQESNPDQDGRSARIEQVVASLVRQDQAGNSAGDAEIERRFPELMPELAERLQTARAIQAAAETARQEPSPEDSGESGGELFEDEAKWLDESLTGFEVLERLDRGGQGSVYKAIQKAANRTVAIKILHGGPLSSPHQRHRFAREVDLISKLRHPNIVTLFESGVVRGRQFFAMEFVEGLPIDDYALLHRPPPKDCVRVFTKICRAVSYAHQRGIIHRDLKPANIMVDLDDEPHILDFGLAKRIEEAAAPEEESSPSMAGQVFGTLPYLSPEQASGSPDETDVRSDIYTLGVILYRLLTGTFPYPVKGDPETVRSNIITSEPISFRQAMKDPAYGIRPSTGPLSDDLERIVLKALSKDRNRRYQSAAALADDLDRYLAGDAVEAKADSRLYLLRKAAHRYRVHVAVAAAFLILLLAALAGMAILWQRAERVTQIAQAGLQMSSFVELGSVARDEGRVDGGMAMFRKALEIAETVPSSDPMVQRYRYGAHYQLAQLHLGRDDPEEAASHCQEAIQIVEDMLRDYPNDPEWRRMLGSIYVLRGRLAASSQEWERAIEDLEQAVGVYEEVLARDPENAVHKNDIAYARNIQGQCYRKLKQYAKSFGCYTIAHDIFRALAREEPDNLHYAIELTRTETKFSAWHLSQKTPEHDREAAEWLDRSAQRLTELDASGRLGARRRDADQLNSVIQYNRELIARRAAKRRQAP